MATVVMLMIDGFGVPPEGWGESVFSKLGSPEMARLFEKSSKPVDACLGVEGLPQSATGQTALFTGVNAPAAVGRHMQGFPGPSLRAIIEKENLFSMALKRGFKPVFANAYANTSLKELEERGLRSVTTVMVASSLGEVLGSDDLRASNAVYHDITRERLKKGGMEDLELVSPEKAARDLAEISKSCDLALFEHFMTDKAGHKADPEVLEPVLKILSRFLLELAKALPKGAALIATSDHGNCEDLSTKTHTRNQVPLLALGSFDEKAFAEAKSIADVPDFVLRTLEKGRTPVPT